MATGTSEFRFGPFYNLIAILIIYRDKFMNYNIIYGNRFILHTQIHLHTHMSYPITACFMVMQAGLPI